MGLLSGLKALVALSPGKTTKGQPTPAVSFRHNYGIGRRIAARGRRCRRIRLPRSKYGPDKRAGEKA